MLLTRKAILLSLLLLSLSLPLLVMGQAETTVAIGDTVSGELTASSPSATYSIDAHAGDELTFSVTSDAFDSYLTLLDAGGASLATDDDSGGDKNASIQAFVVPEDGTYSIKVESYNQVSTGAYTLTVTGEANAVPSTPTPGSTSTPEATPAGTQPPSTGSALAYGDSDSATLTEQSNVVYTFDGKAGDVVTIELTSPDFDAYLSLQDSSGDEIASDDDSAGNLNARIASFALPADGTYTIVAGSYGGGISGAYTISLSSGDATAVPTEETATPEVTATATATATEPVANGGTAGTLTNDLLSASYTFEGSSGDTVTITLTSPDFDSYLILQGPDGRSVAEDDDSAGNLNSTIQNFSLPEDGTYTIIASSNNRAEVGEYLIEVTGATITAAQALTPTAPPPTPIAQQGGDIAVGTSVTGSLGDDAETTSYAFTLDTDQSVTITLTSDAFDTFVSLQDANSTELTSDDDGAGNLNSRIENYALTAGTYMIVVSSSGGVFSGEFTLTVEEGGTVEPTAEPTSQPTTVPPGSDIVIGESVNGELAGNTTADSYTFEGEAGQTVSISVTSDAFDTFLILTGPNGAQLLTDDDSGGNLNALIESYALPDNGTYTVTVGSFDGTGRGVYTLTLLEGGVIQPTAEPTAQPTIEPTDVPPGGEIAVGQSVSGSLDSGTDSASYTFEGESGQTISISASSDEFDTYLRIQDEDGNDLATDDDGGGDLDSRITLFTIPYDGLYTITVENYDGNAGDYTLSISAATVSSIEFGETVEGELTSDEVATAYEFEGEEGDVIALQLSSPDFDTYLSLSEATDTSYALVENDDSGGGDVYNSSIGPFTLPVSGSYIITVRSYDGSATGHYTLNLVRAQLQPVEYDSPVTANFGDGVSTVFYSFEGKNGDVINIEVDSDNGVDTSLVLNGPDNYEITSDDDGGRSFDPEVTSLILTQDGTYTIALQAVNANDSGTVSLTVTQAPLRSLDDGPQQVKLNSKQYQDALTFTGVAGQTVRLVADVSTGGEDNAPTFTVIQDGATIASGSGSTISRLVIEFTVPDDGSVTVQISDYSYTQQIIDVTLEQVE